MENMPPFVVDPHMQFADIIVPTLDTIRASFIIELLLTSNKQVSLTYSSEIYTLC